MACARLPGSTLLKKVLDVCWSAVMRSIAYGIAVDVLSWANVSHLRLSAMIYRSKFPFEVKGSPFLWLACWTRLSPTRRCAWDLNRFAQAEKFPCYPPFFESLCSLWPGTDECTRDSTKLSENCRFAGRNINEFSFLSSSRESIIQFDQGSREGLCQFFKCFSKGPGELFVLLRNRCERLQLVSLKIAGVEQILSGQAK